MAIKHHMNGLLLAPHQLPRCSSCSLVLHDRFMMLHDGFHPRIHVDKDEVLAKIIDDCSFEDAVPRPGALPKGTAGSTPLERLEHVSKGFMFLCVSPFGANIKCKLTTRLSRVGHHGPSNLSMRRDAASRHAESMRSGEQQQRGLTSCP